MYALIFFRVNFSWLFSSEHTKTTHSPESNNAQQTRQIYLNCGNHVYEF